MPLTRPLAQQPRKPALSVCNNHRRDAGNLLGRLGCTPVLDLRSGAVLLAPADSEPTDLDVFCRIPGMPVWIGKYPVTVRQFTRFVIAGGYACREYWSDAGWAWRVQEQRTQPRYWEDRTWHSPLYPVVGVS